MPGWQVLRRRRRYEVLGLQRHCRRLLRLLQRLQFPGGDVKLRPFDNDGGWHGVLFQHRLHQRQVRGRALDVHRWQVLRRRRRYEVLGLQRHCRRLLRLRQRLQFSGGDIELRPLDNNGGRHGVFLGHRLHQWHLQGFLAVDECCWQVLCRWHASYLCNLWRHGWSMLRLSFWLPAHCLGVGRNMRRAAPRWWRRLCVGRRHVCADG